jgi:hypothetical protein
MKIGVKICARRVSSSSFSLFTSHINADATTDHIHRFNHSIIESLIIIMASSTDDDQPDAAPEEAQSLFVIRHGDRWDYQHPEWLETAKRRGDPPLSTLGHEQARETGIFLDRLLAKEGFTGDKITWLASPFLRTLQTSDDALNAFTEIDSKGIAIRPEYSVFEMDGHDGVLHKDLPGMDERKCYFPRLNEAHESLFVPELPGMSLESNRSVLPSYLCTHPCFTISDTFDYTN